MTRKLLSVTDVRGILSVSRRTVYYWIKNGILKPVRIGRILRFHFEDIQHLIEHKDEQTALRKKRILAIDDDLLVRQSMKMLLEANDLEVSVASGADEAVDLIGRKAFDLILTDMRMPKVNGLETLKMIRSERAKYGKAPLPEIILTAYDDEFLKKEASDLGVRDFLLKPFDLTDFLRTIRQNLNYEYSI